MKSRFNRRLLKNALAGATVAAIASTPLLGSAAGLANTPFAIKAVNSDSSGKFAIKPFLKSESATGGEPAAPVPTDSPVSTPQPDVEPTRAPDPTPDLISLKIDTSLPGCTATTTGYKFVVPSYDEMDPSKPALPLAATVNWGDSSTNSTVTLDSNSHVYKAGKYTVSITGKLGGLIAGGTPNCISEVTHFGENTGIKTLNGFLSNAQNVTAVAAPPTSLETGRLMLSNAKNFTGDTSDWTLPNLKDASYMFSGALLFNGDLSRLNPKNLTTAESMFNTSRAFEGKGLERWKTPKLNNMSKMFYSGRSFKANISGWDVSKVTNFSGLFADTPINYSLSSWNTSSATDMSSMFYLAANFNQPLESWDVSHVTNFFNMFSGATSFNQPLNRWDVSSATIMQTMFRDAKSFQQNLYDWSTKTGKVRNMNSMFEGALAFQQNLSTWNVNNVTDSHYFGKNSGMESLQKTNWPKFSAASSA